MKKRAVPSFEIFKAVNSSRRFLNLKGSWSMLFVDREPLKTTATFYLVKSGTTTERITADRNPSTIFTVWGKNIIEQIHGQR